MSDPTPLLSREQRRRLLDALNNLPMFEQEEGRTLLLSDLPPSLIQQVPRSNTKIIDLEAIVRTVEGWGVLDDGTPALAILMENARFYGQGGNAGRSLDELSTELAPLLAAKPPTPAAAAVKEAAAPVAPALVSAAAAPPVVAAAQADAPVVSAAASLDPAPAAVEPALAPVSSPAVVAPAPSPVAAPAPQTPADLAAALTAAHAGQQWVEVLTLARQLGRNLPLALAGLVAKAWHSLPLSAPTLAGHSKKIRTVVISPDGQLALSGSEDNTLILWDLPTGQAIRTMQGEDSAINAAAFAPDGQHAFSVNDGGQLTTWNLASGTAVGQVTVNSTTPVNALAVLPGGQQVVTGGFEGKVKLWDLASGHLVYEMKVGGAVFPQVTSFALLPDGTQVVSGSTRFVEMWNLSTGQQVLTFTDAVSGDTTPVALAPDGVRVLAALGDYSLTLWTLPSTTPTLRLTGHNKTVWAVAFTPNGYYALSGADDDTIRFWDLALGQEVWQFAAGAGGVKALALSPDGRTLLYAGTDKLLHVLTFPPGLFA